MSIVCSPEIRKYFDIIEGEIADDRDLRRYRPDQRLYIHDPRQQRQ